MKIKQDFVTNSSTTSFICLKCGDVEAGMDISLEEANMVECSAGHVFHDGCFGDVSMLTEREKEIRETYTYVYDLKDDERKKLVAELETCENLSLNEYEENIVYSAKICPICNLELIQDKTILEYLLKTHGLDRAEVENAMRDIGPKFLQSKFEINLS